MYMLHHTSSGRGSGILKKLFCLQFFLLFSLCMYADQQSAGVSGKDSTVSVILNSAFAQEDQNKIIATLVQQAAAQTQMSNRKQLLTALADYEERSGLPGLAVKHYSEAAYADTAARDYALLLDASRCALMSNDVTQANSLVQSVLLSCFDDVILIRARVYAAWVQLASGDRTAAFALIRSYADNHAFSAYAPALLFTLWWANEDSSAKATLLASWPKTPEASVVRGEISLAPVPFWYLMSRNESKVASFAQKGPDTESMAGTVPDPITATDSGGQADTPPTATVNSSSETTEGIWQQVGFFRNREYADDLVAKLKKLGFSPVIHSEKRPSGTVYFSVLVPEDAERSVGPRLKNAGFESYLLIE